MFSVRCLFNIYGWILQCQCFVTLWGDVFCDRGKSWDGRVDGLQFHANMKDQAVFFFVLWTSRVRKSKGRWGNDFIAAIMLETCFKDVTKLNATINRLKRSYSMSFLFVVANCFHIRHNASGYKEHYTVAQTYEVYIFTIQRYLSYLCATV